MEMIRLQKLCSLKRSHAGIVAVLFTPTNIELKFALSGFEILDTVPPDFCLEFFFSFKMQKFSSMCKFPIVNEEHLYCGTYDHHS